MSRSLRTSSSLACSPASLKATFKLAGEHADQPAGQLEGCLPVHVVLGPGDEVLTLLDDARDVVALVVAGEEGHVRGGVARIHVLRGLGRRRAGEEDEEGLRHVARVVGDDAPLRLELVEDHVHAAQDVGEREAVAHVTVALEVALEVLHGAQHLGVLMASRSLPSATTIRGSTPPNLSWMWAWETL